MSNIAVIVTQKQNKYKNQEKNNRNIVILNLTFKYLNLFVLRQSEFSFLKAIKIFD